MSYELHAMSYMLSAIRPWRVHRLGTVPYDTALALQHRLVADRVRGALEADVVLVLEHPPVFTLGRRGGAENLLVDEAFLARQGIAVVAAERGGSITYHGPGQIVVYPIVSLKAAGIKVVDFVAGLESAMMATAAAFGIAAATNPANRGVWVQGAKLGSIGITVRHGVSFHGLALNVNTDLAPFDWINPCGLTGVAMTSLAQQAGQKLEMDAVTDLLLAAFEKVFNCRCVPSDRNCG